MMNVDLIKQLDVGLREYSSVLRDDFKISPPESNELATAICCEIQQLDDQTRHDLQSEPPLSTAERLLLLNVFMHWWRTTPGTPENNIGQIMALNYFCIVYLGESHLKKLEKCAGAPLGKKCAKFLRNKSVRALRNAVSHANWRPSADGIGIDFWARPGEIPFCNVKPKCSNAPEATVEPMREFKVSVEELNFWHLLSIATAYASLSVL
jgi:hypothetical protein